MERAHLSWQDVEDLVDRLVGQLPNPAEYDVLMVITRGGMIPAALISEATGIRNIVAAAVMFFEGLKRPAERPFFLQFPENDVLRGRRVLVVDDIWGNGRVAVGAKMRVVAAGGRPEVAVLHYRPAESEFPNERPDFVAEVTERWIVYPWDRIRRWSDRAR